MKKILFTLLCCLSPFVYPKKLSHPTLKLLDQKGHFNPHIFEIVQIREQIKDLILGKHLWKGITLNLQSTSNTNLTCSLKRIETLYGITFVTISSEHPNLKAFVMTEYKEAVDQFITQSKKQTNLQKHENKSIEGVFTGSYIQHPLTNEQLPLFVADYNIDLFNVRTQHANLAVPAHNDQDFQFAQKYNLPITLVLAGAIDDSEETLPKLSKDKKLLIAYKNSSSFCQVINSDFLNGTIKSATQEFTKYIPHYNKENPHLKITETKQPILYEFESKNLSIEQLKNIEKAGNLTSQQKETLQILLKQAQTDFLDIVEPFLIYIHKTKAIMSEFVAESCELRQNKQSYLLQWSQLDNAHNSEKEIFKRDITNIQQLFTFCSDLVNFLGDLASSCTNAIDFMNKEIERIKNTKP